MAELCFDSNQNRSEELLDPALHGSRNFRSEGEEIFVTKSKLHEVTSGVATQGAKRLCVVTKSLILIFTVSC